MPCHASHALAWLGEARRGELARVWGEVPVKLDITFLGGVGGWGGGGQKCSEVCAQMDLNKGKIGQSWQVGRRRRRLANQESNSQRACPGRLHYL